MNKILASLLVGFFLVPSAAFAQTRPDSVDLQIADLMRQVIALQAILASMQAPKVYVDPVTQGLLDAFEANARDIENSRRANERIMNNWANSSRSQIDEYDACEDAIDDAEDDIRAEVEARGGYVSNSQLRSMAMNRTGC